MSADINRFISYIRKKQGFFIAVILVLNVFFAFQLPSLRIDNSLDVWFAKEDPALKAYIQFKKEFGNDEVVITSLEFDQALTKVDPIRKLIPLRDSILNIYGTSRVMSILDIPVSVINNQPVYLDDNLSNDSLDDQSFRKLEQIREFKTSKRFLLEDFSCLVFYTWLDTLPDIEQRRTGIHDQILHHILQIYGDSVTINQSGPGIIYNTLNKETLAQVPKMMGLAYFIVLLLVFLFTRRMRWVLITFFAITLSNVMLFGIMALVGSKPNMVTMAIPPLIVVIGVANIIHYAKGMEHIAAGKKTGKLSDNLLSVVLKPLLFNALTTAGGFASLSVANLQVTREYGIYASAGVLIAFIHSLLLSILFAGSENRKSYTAPWLKKFEEKIVRLMVFSATHRKTILILSILFVFIFGYGLLKIEADTNTADFFQKNHPIQHQIDEMQNKLGYFYPADFLIRYKDRNWKDKEFLEKLAHLQVAIDKDTLFGTTFSIADLLNDSYSLMTGEYHNSVENFSLLSQRRILALARPIQKSEYYSQLVTDKGKTVRLSVTGPIESAKTYIILTSYFERVAKEAFGEGLSLQPAGNLPLYSQSIRYTMHDQLTSLGLAICVILILIGLLLRSFRLSLLAIPSNLLPIIFILGIMGYFNIRLDLATVTIAAAILGIIVDDTIHLLYGFKNLLSEQDPDLNLIKSLAHRKGPALVFTSFILISGFVVIGMAGLRSIARPGWLIALAVFIALITDLFILPALLVRHKKPRSE